MSELVRIPVNSNPEWTTIQVPRQARPVGARRTALGGEISSSADAYNTYWEVPSNALAGEETYLVRRGILPDPAPGSPDEPPHDALSESGLPGATTLFADDSEFFWVYRDLFQYGSGYPPNQA
ncbi:hypothetical protein ACFO5K_08265 [Nocardia halotolerans]|uniref:Uncharacterized protein n=1 Tax=Nocardia halotolerans TaxID=1755878 RepID=A0ABV8VDK6_9NOCA